MWPAGNPGSSALGRSQLGTAWRCSWRLRPREIPSVAGLAAVNEESCFMSKVRLTCRFQIQWSGEGQGHSPPCMAEESPPLPSAGAQLDPRVPLLEGYTTAYSCKQHCPPTGPSYLFGGKGPVLPGQEPQAPCPSLFPLPHCNDSEAGECTRVYLMISEFSSITWGPRYKFHLGPLQL